MCRVVARLGLYAFRHLLYELSAMNWQSKYRRRASTLALRRVLTIAAFLRGRRTGDDVPSTLPDAARRRNHLHHMQMQSSIGFNEREMIARLRSVAPHMKRIPLGVPVPALCLVASNARGLTQLWLRTATSPGGSVESTPASLLVLLFCHAQLNAQRSNSGALQNLPSQHLLPIAAWRK